LQVYKIIEQSFSIKKSTKLNMAGLTSGGVLVEILNGNGTMARLPQLIKMSLKFNIKIISIEDLIQYRLKNKAPKMKEKELNSCVH